MPEGVISRLKQGWLIKQGGRVKNWKRRFFVLDGSRRLTYYVSEADAQAGVNQLGLIDLQKALFVKPRAQGTSKSAGSTTIAWPASVSNDFCFMIITNDRNYGIYSDISKDDCRNWVKALQDVRGNVDSNEIMVEVSSNGATSASASTNGDDDQPDHYGAAGYGRSRANTVAAIAAYKSLPERYNMPPDLTPKVVVMYARWHRVLDTTLDSLASHFGVKEFKLECNMGQLYSQTPKAVRGRLGELVFADYIDELRYNLVRIIGNESVGKSAFVAATRKGIVRFSYGKLKEDELVRAYPSEGCIVIEVDAKNMGKGVHLTGQRFLNSMLAGSEEPVCGGVLKGLPLKHALNICAARSSCSASLQRIGKMLSLPSTPTFKCNYLSVHKESRVIPEFQSKLGDVVVKNLLAEAANCIHAQVTPGKRSSVAGCLSAGRVVFELASDATAKETATINHNGELVLAAGLDKLHELAVYERPGHFRLAALIKQCSDESAM